MYCYNLEIPIPATGMLGRLWKACYYYHSPIFSSHCHLGEHCICRTNEEASCEIFSPLEDSTSLELKYPTSTSLYILAVWGLLLLFSYFSKHTDMIYKCLLVCFPQM